MYCQYVINRTRPLAISHTAPTCRSTRSIFRSCYDRTWPGLADDSPRLNDRSRCTAARQVAKLCDLASTAASEPYTKSMAAIGQSFEWLELADDPLPLLSRCDDQAAETLICLRQLLALDTADKNAAIVAQQLHAIAVGDGE